MNKLASFKYMGALTFMICLQSCQKNLLPRNFVLPQPENTFSKPIQYQEKKTYTINGISANNTFDCARMNDFQKINDTTYRVVISPENTPINASSYFAFRIWSESPVKIDLELFYTEHEHRYWPKLSHDIKHWNPIDSSLFDTIKAPNIATLKLNISEDTLYVSAQEIFNSRHSLHWCDTLDQNNSSVRFSLIGKSKLGRDLPFLDIYEGSVENKDCIIIFSRLHPPEITGALAMESFVNTILDNNSLSNTFRKKIRVLVYPMLNPDGVDLGHWRHNAGGIDLNRDWSHYRQEETKVIASHAVHLTKTSKNKVILGMDFHSTQEDLYYTLTDNRRSNIYNFKDLWMQAIDERLPEYSPDDQPYDLNQPITKAWFYLQFNAEGITYEIGDETPRDFINQKAEIAAKEMMKLLVLRN